MKYHLITLGCQMNKSDSERLMGVLEDLGYKPTGQEEEADLLIVNACSVRQRAIDRVYGRLKKWQELKREKPAIKTILTGCVLPMDKQKFASKFDLIFNIKALSSLPQMLENLGVRGDHPFPLSQDYFKIPPKIQNKISAYIPIMTGCDNYCSYCAVPLTRGREVSRPVPEILAEIEDLIEKGYQDFTLLGQNVNSYRDKKIDFVELLKKICQLPGPFYLKFYSNHPKDFSESLIDLMSREEKIVKYVHLPLQSGDDEILRRMNRRYTRAEYLRLVDKIRSKIPEVVISTDAIVGFPGESKSQFQNTVKVFRQVGFDMAYIARFSPRLGTRAAKLKDDIPHPEKKQREKILTEILKKTALTNNQKLLGKTVKAVVTEKKKKNLWQAETLTLKSIQFKSKDDLRARIVNLKVIRANPWSLEGELI